MILIVVVHRNNSHGKCERSAGGIRRCVCENVVVWWKIITHKITVTLLDSVENGKGVVDVIEGGNTPFSALSGSCKGRAIVT